MCVYVTCLRLPLHLLDHTGVLECCQVDVQLDQFMVDQLRGIAKELGGKVPIHGRLFAQWLLSCIKKSQGSHHFCYSLGSNNEQPGRC